MTIPKNVVLVQPRVSKNESTMYLCSLDQHLAYFVHSLFFFSAEFNFEDLSRKLQEALANVLVPYYFFAGRLKVNADSRLEIVCNGYGAWFSTSDSDLRISDAQTPCEMDLFFLEPSADVPLEELPLLTVQLTKLKDGYAVGIRNHHILADATSGIQFHMSLASFTRGEAIMSVVSSDRTRLRATKKLEHPEFLEGGKDHFFDLSSGLRDAVINSDKIRKELLQKASLTQRKIYHVTSKRQAVLKETALVSSILTKCSTFEALAAHVWKAHATMLRDKQHLRLQFVVDVRNLLNPPLGSDFCGNAYFPARTEMVSREELIREPLGLTVRRLQLAREQLTDEYVRSAWDFLERHPSYWYQHDCDTVINSWPRIMQNALDLDFGHGKAARVEFPRDPRNTKIFLFPLKRDGVDVSVCIEPSALQVFEAALFA